MVVMPVYHFSIHLSAEEFLDYYRRRATHVVVQSEEGPTVQFAAAKLRTFVTRSGVQGRFALHCGPDNAFVELKQVSA